MSHLTNSTHGCHGASATVNGEAYIVILGMAMPKLGVFDSNEERVIHQVVLLQETDVALYNSDDVLKVLILDVDQAWVPNLGDKLKVDILQDVLLAHKLEPTLSKPQVLPVQDLSVYSATLEVKLVG